MMGKVITGLMCRKTFDGNHGKMIGSHTSGWWFQPMSSSVGMMKFPIYGKTKIHVPNHQPDMVSAGCSLTSMQGDRDPDDRSCWCIHLSNMLVVLLLRSDLVNPELFFRRTKMT